MGLRDFLKPTKATILMFVILLIVFYFIFASVNLRVFSCKTQPVIPNPPAFKDSVCSLTDMNLGFDMI
ncbi:MAG: hypothetical protein NT120_00260, partial [Candidatus Aenigmarchaeota archaeon]|nr:hypothetical protein [Candidatus Aenigmarchaeota archaeon]